VKVYLYTYIQIYLYIWSMPKSFIKERFWVSPFVVQRVSLEMCGWLCSVYMYIQSARKDRIRSVLWSFAQEDPVAGYMDHNAHGSVIYIYCICTYRVLRRSRGILFYITFHNGLFEFNILLQHTHKLIDLISIGLTFITCPFQNISMM